MVSPSRSGDSLLRSPAILKQSGPDIPSVGQGLAPAKADSRVGPTSMEQEREQNSRFDGSPANDQGLSGKDNSHADVPGRGRRPIAARPCRSRVAASPYSGEDRITAAKQDNCLPHGSEKQQHQCHSQQHIYARGGEKTCDNVALKDSLEVYGVQSAFLRGLTGHTLSSLPQRGAAPILAAPSKLGQLSCQPSLGSSRSQTLGGLPTDRALEKPPTSCHLVPAGVGEGPRCFILSAEGGYLFARRHKPENLMSQHAGADRLTFRRVEVLVVRFTGKVLSHNMVVHAQHVPVSSTPSERQAKDKWAGRAAGAGSCENLRKGM